MILHSARVTCHPVVSLSSFGRREKSQVEVGSFFGGGGTRFLGKFDWKKTRVFDLFVFFSVKLSFGFVCAFFWQKRLKEG